MHRTSKQDGEAVGAWANACTRNIVKRSCLKVSKGAVLSGAHNISVPKERCCAVQLRSGRPYSQDTLDTPDTLDVYRHLKGSSN